MSAESPVPALVLGNGITALGVIRALARSGVSSLVVTDRPGFLKGSRHYHPAPAAGPVPVDGGLAVWLERLPLASAVLVPCSDTAMVAVSRLPDAIRSRFPASVPPAATADVMVDKAAFGHLLERNGLPHPRTVELRHAGDLDGVDDALLARSFLKPTSSQEFYQLYGQKALKIAGREDGRERVREVLDRGLGVTLQEMIPGPADHQLCVDGFMDAGGTIRGLFARQWLRKHPSDFGESCLAVSLDPGEVEEPVRLARELVNLLPFRGPFSVELKKDEDTGRWIVLELNARPWWYVDFTCRAGMDVCGMLYRDALGQSVESVERYQIGRYVVHPELDRAARQEAGVRGGTARRLARQLAAVQPIFSWGDPGPTIHHLGARLVRRLRRAARGTTGKPAEASQRRQAC